MKKYIKYIIVLVAIGVVAASCMKDLDTVPIDPDELTSTKVFEDPASYKQILGKLYAGLAVSGQQGPSGQPDISGIDEGFGQYLRGLWYHQELTTDEAVISWNDQTVKDFHWQSWGTTDVFIQAFYYRIFYQISAVNEYIRETSDSKLDERGVTGTLREDIEYYRAEARWLRALSYWHAMDHFGNVPFVTEEDQVGAFFPNQISRADLFSYIESELKAVESLLMDPGANEYARVDKAGAWMLLAKLYLNAEVYTGQQKYTDCITYCSKIVNAGFDLKQEYAELFMADNHLENNEIIFPIAFDGAFTKTWGGMTFIIRAGVGGDMVPEDYGIASGWGGTRTTSAIVRKFYPDIEGGLIVSPIPERSVSDYPVLYVPGSYQGWNPENDSTVIASVNSDGNYEGYLYFAEAPTEYKFTTQPNWDINWGDDNADGTLEENGANIIADEPGYYKINVDANALTHTFLKTEWGVIGDATENGWDSDQDMEFDPLTGLWTVRLDLIAGELKFRANDGWDINLGDSGEDGILDYGGDNIKIDTDGTYVIKLKLGVPDYTYTIERGAYDRRAMFFSEGQNLEIEDIGLFTDGWAVAKFTNLDRNGNPGSDSEMMDTDFPMFRLADAYLMYAEAVLRGGGGGDLGTALEYVNKVRERAYAGSTDGHISASELTLDFIIDERAREFCWEAQRRTDLVRFGMFTGDKYLWPWKGNLKEGRPTDQKYDLFPIPDSDLNANPNLSQNPGY